MFVDTHMHVADRQFDVDREAVIARAREAQVGTLIEIAESPGMWDAAVALADQHPFIYASLGIHPHHAHEAGPDRWPELEKKLRELLRHPKVVALGEFGLDYFRMENTKEQQQFIFRKQLELAKELKKPIVVHCREDQLPQKSSSSAVGGGGPIIMGSPPAAAGNDDGSGAHEDVLQALNEFYPGTSTAINRLRPEGVVHCFTGTWTDAQTYLSHGFMVGIDAPVTYPSARQLQENVLRLPLERMVLETDSPYLPPQTRRGQRNEPHHVPLIAETIGSIKRKTTEEVARQTTANAKALFRLG